MRMRALLFVTAAGLLVAADAKDDAVKKEMDKLQGTWKVVKAVKQGGDAPEDERKKLQVVIVGDKLTMKTKNGAETTPFVIDPSKKPATIDLTLDETRTLQGIYELDKDALKICVGLSGEKRPGEFKSTRESTLLILEREKK